MRALRRPIILSYVGLAFFLYGFFLTRRELNLRASVETFHTNICAIHLNSDQVVSLNSILNAPPSHNHMESIKNPPPKKIFLFIVDALRLDFMTRKEGSTEPHSPYNRFQSMHRLLEQNASQSLLFGFRADPPTVTSQRLKSLTTGSLPTFIDIGANMNSSAITEDNFIDQLLSRATLKNSQSSNVCNTASGTNTDSTSSTDFNNQNINTTCPNPTPVLIVLGDDTWGSLYPTQFTITHYYDSFNTRDLDSVDQGIISHLFDYLPCGNNLSAPIRNISDYSQRTDIVQYMECEESNKPKWDLMIAHFLGVDHIGHTHHAFHPLMAERLALMDELLLQVIERLPPNSVLFLFGDHGMTDQGEHGGSTRHETDSGLFVYSTEPMFSVHGTSNYTNANNDTYECKNGVPIDTNTNNVTNATTLYWNDTTQTFVHTSLHTILTNPRVVPQIDFTPTISTLLGVPIPASSLGKIIPELFMNNYMEYRVESGNDTSSSETRCLNYRGVNNVNKCCEEDRLLNLYFTNAMQVWRYLTAYWGKDPVTANSSTTTSKAHASVLNVSRSMELLQLSNSTHIELVYLEELLLQAIQAHLQYVQLCAAQIDTTCKNNTTIAADKNGVYAKYIHFLTEVQAFTRHKWTQFKTMPMLTGLTLLVCALLIFAYRTYLTISSTYKATAAVTDTYRSDGTAPKVSTTSILTFWQSLPALVCSTMHTLSTVRPAIIFVVPVGVVFHSLAALSNNFTEQEYWTVFGLVHACTISLATQLWYTPPPKDQGNDQLKQSRKKSILLLLLTLSTVGVCLIWQYGPHSTHSFNSQVQLPLWLHAVVPGSVYNAMRNAIVIGSIIVLLWLYNRCINCLTIGNGGFMSFGDTYMRFNNILSGACVVTYWAVKYNVIIIDLDVSPTVLLWCANHPCCTFLYTADWLIILPRSVILLCTINTICALYNICTTTSPKRINDNSVYDHRPMLRNLLHVVVSFALILGPMLGPVGCVCIVLCLVHTTVFVYCYVHILCTTRVRVGRSGSVNTASCDDTTEQTTEENALSATDLTQLCTYVVYAAYFPLMGRFLYFVTGHRMDFGTLQLWSGFIGSHTFEFYYAGMCLAINTFGAFVLYVLCLYAAVVYLLEAPTTDKSSHVEGRELSDRSTTIPTMSTYVHSVLYISLTYQCTIMCVSCIGAAVLRRHLMVWAVFAPKMAFEACIWLSVSLTALVVESVLTL